MKYTLLFIFFLFLSFVSKSQVDSTGNYAVTDTSRELATPVETVIYVDSIYQKLLDNPYLQAKGPRDYLVIQQKISNSKDEIFYLLMGLLLFLAFIRSVFSRYFHSLFQVLFQPSFRQKQTREQLNQSSLPAFLLNIFFILSGGVYIVLIMQFYHVAMPRFWIGLLFSTLLLFILYLGKYIFLSFAGWVFQAKQTTDSYTYIVFLINKILGVMLLPFIFLIAFGKPEIVQISVTITIILIFLLFTYRYLVAISLVRKEIKLSTFHFFLYIISIEIIPLLLIYKSLGLYLDITL